jgi:membrane-associated phospholipid phosphatase
VTPGAPLRPVDRLLILYNVGFAVLWGSAIGRYPDAALFAASHVLVVALVMLTGRPGARASRFGLGVREVYPIALIAIYWLEMGLVRDAFHATAHDALIAAADLRLFGVHLHEIWIPAMPWLWFSEIMNAAYWFYYPLVFLTPLVLFLRKRNAQVTEMVFALSVAYLACYVSYALFPVDGPSHTMAKFQGPFMQGFFYRLVNSGTHAGDSMGTAFPSSHVLGAVTAALFAWRRLSRPVATLFALGALGVMLSTVYRQSHFAIDSLVGAVGAVVLYFGVTPYLARLLAPAPPRRQTIADSR